MNTVETEQGISVDCTMHLCGNSDVIIEGASGPVVVPVELSNLVISGVLRVTFAALSKDVVRRLRICSNFSNLWTHFSNFSRNSSSMQWTTPHAPCDVL